MHVNARKWLMPTDSQIRENYFKMPQTLCRLLFIESGCEIWIHVELFKIITTLVCRKLFIVSVRTSARTPVVHWPPATSSATHIDWLRICLVRCLTVLLIWLNLFVHFQFKLTRHAMNKHTITTTQHEAVIVTIGCLRISCIWLWYISYLYVLAFTRSIVKIWSQHGGRLALSVNNY